MLGKAEDRSKELGARSQALHPGLPPDSRDVNASGSSPAVFPGREQDQKWRAQEKNWCAYGIFVAHVMALFTNPNPNPCFIKK